MANWKKTKPDEYSQPLVKELFVMALSGEEYLPVEVWQCCDDDLWRWEVFGKPSKKKFKTSDEAKDDALNMAEMMLGEAIYECSQRNKMCAKK